MKIGRGLWDKYAVYMLVWCWESLVDVLMVEMEWYSHGKYEN